MKRRDLREFVARVGSAEAARRFGISEKALRGWISKGIPARRVASIEVILRRHRAGRKAAATAERHRRFREGGWADELSIPGKQRRGERLTDEQQTPQRDPRLDELAARKRAQWAAQTGWYEELSTHWVFYTSPYQPLGMGLDTYLVNQEGIAERAVQLWREIDPSSTLKNSGLWFQLQLLRYYPDNPAYKGKPELMRKAGHWGPMRLLSAGLVRNEHEVVRLVSQVVHQTNIIERDGPKQREIGSIVDDAETRIFWVDGFSVKIGFERPEVDLTELVTGKEPRKGPQIVPRPRRRRRKR